MEYHHTNIFLTRGFVRVAALFLTPSHFACKQKIEILKLLGGIPSVDHVQVVSLLVGFVILQGLYEVSTAL